MLHPEISIALARAGDAAEIARMSRDLIEDGLPWAWRPERVAASVRRADANVVVARLGERLAGFGIMRYGDDDAHLDLLGIAPEFSRRGLGRRLVQWLEKPATLGGIARVVLEVREHNVGAQVFYERLGFTAIGCVEGYYQGRETAVRMAHALS